MNARDRLKFFSRQIHAVEIVSKRIAADARFGVRDRVCKTLDKAYDQALDSLNAAKIVAYGRGESRLSSRHEARLELAECQLRYSTKAAEMRCRGRTHKDDVALEAALERYDACTARARKGTRR